jgi:hypothetical protein
MDLLLAISILLSGLAALAAAAVRWGADSRDRLPDDHQR